MFADLLPGVYYQGDSLLHRLQARTKLLLLLWLVLFMTVANQRKGHWAPYVLVVTMALLAMRFSRLPVAHLWRRTRLLLLYVLLATLPPLFLTDGTAIHSFGPYRLPDGTTLGPLVISDQGLWLSVGILTVLLVFYILALLLTMTTSPVALLEGMTLLLGPLRRFKLPVDDFALMTLVALRFVPTLAEEMDQLIKAQLARGADFSHGTMKEQWQSLIGFFVPLLHGALRRAGELATALESRGYEIEGQQTLLHEGSLRTGDYLLLCGVVLATLGSLIL